MSNQSFSKFNFITALKNVWVTNHRKSAFRWVSLIFLSSIFIKLCYVYFLVTHGGTDALVLGDSTRYLTLAQNVLTGQGYLYDGHLESYRAPGYPLYLMFFEYFSISLLAASFFQILIASLFPLVSFFVSYKFLNLSLKTSGVVGLLTAVEPVQNFYGATLMPDVFFSATLLLGVFFFHRWFCTSNLDSIVIGGICIGISNYFRPAGVYLTLLLSVGVLAVFVYNRTITIQRVYHAGLFILIPIIIMMPWSFRNLAQFQHFGFVSALPYNTYTYGAVSTEAAHRGVEYETVRKEFVEKANANMPNPTHPTSFENSEYYIEKSIESIKQHPTSWFCTYLLGLNTFWFSGNYHYLLARYGIIDFPQHTPSFSMILAGGGLSAVISTMKELGSQPYLYIALVGKGLWVIITLGALLGAFTVANRRASLLFLLLVLYFSITILPMTIGVEARHRYPMIPLLFPFFVAGVLYILHHPKLSLLRTNFVKRK